MKLTSDEKIKRLTHIVDEILSIVYFDNNGIIKTYQYQAIKKSIRALEEDLK